MIEMNNDDYERIEEIKTLSTDFLVEALHWWNDDACEKLKHFIIVTCYYEFLTMKAEDADDFLADITAEGEV